MSETELQTAKIERVVAIIDFQVVNFIAPGTLIPSSVGIILTVANTDEPMALRIPSRRALDQLVDALMRHGDEVFGVGKIAPPPPPTSAQHNIH